MSDEPKATWYYRRGTNSEVTGPVELIELAALLRTGDLPGATLRLLEGETLWTAFAQRREFEWARGMPVGVIMRHPDQKADDAAEAKPFTWKKIHAFFALIVGVSWYTLGVAFHARIYSGNHHEHDPNMWLARLMFWLSGHHQ